MFEHLIMMERDNVCAKNKQVSAPHSTFIDPAKREDGYRCRRVASIVQASRCPLGDDGFTEKLAKKTRLRAEAESDQQHKYDFK